MTTQRKKRNTYRLSEDVDKAITERASKLGISKNDFVQQTLYKILVEKSQEKSTGTEGYNE